MDTTIIAIYFIVINAVSAWIFTFDKLAAIKNKPRTSEQKLHLFEILGGVFANLLLMYLLRHKNKKFSYWIWTWLILLVWIAILFYYISLNF